MNYRYSLSYTHLPVDSIQLPDQIISKLSNYQIYIVKLRTYKINDKTRNVLKMAKKKTANNRTLGKETLCELLTITL